MTPTPKPGGHSKGPWTVRKDRRAAHSSTIMAGATAIAKCNEFVAEVEANAQLIAAAPLLLEALKELSARVDSWHQTCEKSILTLKARIAIEQAEAHP